MCKYHVFLQWLPCGSRVAPVWLPCGSRVALVWLTCGSDEALGRSRPFSEYGPLGQATQRLPWARGHAVREESHAYVIAVPFLHDDGHVNNMLKINRDMYLLYGSPTIAPHYGWWKKHCTTLTTGPVMQGVSLLPAPSHPQL